MTDTMVQHEFCVVREFINEYHKASNKFPAFASAHEGYAVLLEEVEEYWDSVKRNKPDRAELIQVGAMALRAIMDVHDKE